MVNRFGERGGTLRKSAEDGRDDKELRMNQVRAYSYVSCTTAVLISALQWGDIFFSIDRVQ